MSKTTITSVKARFDDFRNDINIADFIRCWKKNLDESDYSESIVEVNTNDEKLGEVLSIMGSIVNDTKEPPREQWSRVAAILRNFHLTVVATNK